MTLYLYRTGETAPLLTLEHAAAYTAEGVTYTDETGAERTLSPLAEGVELSGKADCSEALRAQWRAEHPAPEERIDQLETLVAELLFGGEEA